MGYRIVRKPSEAYIVRSGADYYAADDVTLQTSLGTTDQDYYAVLQNSVFGKILINSVTYLVATANLEMISDVSDYNPINSTDDVIPLRYAYGNQNGYVIGVGSELDGVYNNGTFTVGSGRVVVQGVEIDVDANGMSVAVDTASETRYYKIYLEVKFNQNINLYSATLRSGYSTVGYNEITIPTSSELINGGTAYLDLYWLKLNGTTEVESIKRVHQIDYAINLGRASDGSLYDEKDGAFIVKRKTLWSGDMDISDGQSHFIDGLDLRGKTIEVCVNNEKYYKFKYDDISGNYITNILESVSISASGVYEVSFTVFHDDGRTGFIVVTPFYHWDGTQGSISLGGFSITEIYEIIE